MNDRIRELGFFLRVAEEASFSAAARSLDLDPSTISKVIQRLENRLAVRLFHRTSRVLQLTQEGDRFLRSWPRAARPWPTRPCHSAATAARSAARSMAPAGGQCCCKKPRSESRSRVRSSAPGSSAGSMAVEFIRACRLRAALPVERRESRSR